MTVTATYPGASAETLAKSVAAPIEEQLSGVENLMYFSSTSASNGVLTITATFEVGSDSNRAVIDVNNRIQLALSRLKKRKLQLKDEMTEINNQLLPDIIA